LTPTLGEFIAHARTHGTEGVYETAADGLLRPRDLLRLRVELDAIDAGKRGRFGTVIGKRRKRTSDETRDAVLLLSEEGLVRGAIADKLGISERTVRRHLEEVPSWADSGHKAA
jgi:DNA invertase Pin-like site-specific DNA recombinase